MRKFLIILFILFASICSNTINAFYYVVPPTIDEIYKRLDDLNETMQDLNATVSDLNATVAELNATVEELNNEVNELNLITEDLETRTADFIFTNRLAPNGQITLGADTKCQGLFYSVVSVKRVVPIDIHKGVGNYNVNIFESSGYFVAASSCFSDDESPCSLIIDVEIFCSF